MPDCNRDRVVGTHIGLSVGAPVTLTFNVEHAAGLCNGTDGVVYDLIIAENMEVPIVLVQITDVYVGPSFVADVPNIVPIIPKNIRWSKKTSDLSVYREGLPLRVAYAITVHTVQGLTYCKVVFHSSTVPSVSFANVASSRVRTRDDIVLTTPLMIDKLTLSADKRASFELEEQHINAAVHRTASSARDTILVM
ncbi:hypothetical protein ON010_g8307 [Phytophthora cinnamomi]|nr:hypothetical protein ON010_g8307 [Phytophthora cinnamomi]